MSVTSEAAAGRDEAGVQAGLRLAEPVAWRARWRIEKYAGADAGAPAGQAPTEVVELEGNLLLNGGITELLKLLCGTGGTAYSSANANIVVGDSATAAAAAQTDMQGTTATAAMDSTYPQVTAQTATFRATFGTSAANFAWNELGVKNGAGAVSGAILMLNRKVTSLGTKTSAASWVVTLTITLS
jgi:hypothetical protein